MKTILTLFVLLFSSSVFADDISDFQIEGMSVGDSALDFFTEENINKNEWDYYVDKTFTPVQMDNIHFFKTYDAVDFDYKTGDKKYTIYSLRGVLIYDDNNIADCYKKMDKIIYELKQFFINATFNGAYLQMHSMLWGPLNRTPWYGDIPQTNPDELTKYGDIP